MKVSVIIPTYNSSRFIAEAVESVLAQTVTDLEVIVIDDGSTDDTQDVLASLRDPRVRVFRTENQGMGMSRNEGLQRARGEFIAFNDADDCWRPQKLEKQLAIMESEPEVGVIFADFVRFSDQGFLQETQFSFFPELASVPSVPTRCGIGRRITGDLFVELIRFSQFPTWVQTMLFRAESVRGISFPPGRRGTDDMHYCFRVYQHVGAAYIDEPLVEVRRHDANFTLDLDRLEHDVRRTLCDLEQEVHEPARLVALRRRVGRSWLSSGETFLRQRRFRDTVRAYMRAMSYSGAQLGALKRCALLPIRWFMAKNSVGT